MIKVIFFDLGEVVFTNDWHYDCPEKFAEYEKYFGTGYDQMEIGWKSAWPLYSIGKISEDKFWEIFLTESHANIIDTAKAKQLWRKYFSTKEGVFEVLDTLKSRYKLAVLSSTGQEWMDFKIQKYDLDKYFEDYITSANTGFEKNTSEIYKIALQKFDIKPEEALFIDDTPKVLETASKLGINTLKFINSKQLIADLENMKVIESPIIDLSDRTNMFYWQANRKITAKETKRIFLERHENIDEQTLKLIVSSGLKSAGFSESDCRIENILPIINKGSVNSAVPIVLPSGRKILLRIHPKNIKNGYFWVEKTVTDKVRMMGVPTYETLFIDDSMSVVPFAYMIMSIVPGKPIVDYHPLNIEFEEKLITETGRLVALVHQVKPTGYGFFNNQKAKEKNVLAGQYLTLKEHIWAALELDINYLTESQIISSRQKQSIYELFTVNESLLKNTQGVLIHNDIADWNELTDGENVTGLMDWDECVSGDPLMELATYNLFYGEPRMTWFKNGYEKIAPLENNPDKFQLLKLRYLISKMHLRVKRATVINSKFLNENVKRGEEAMQEVFKYFDL